MHLQEAIAEARGLENGRNPQLTWAISASGAGGYTFIQMTAFTLENNHQKGGPWDGKIARGGRVGQRELKE